MCSLFMTDVKYRKGDIMTSRTSPSPSTKISHLLARCYWKNFTLTCLFLTRLQLSNHNKTFVVIIAVAVRLNIDSAAPCLD